MIQLPSLPALRSLAEWGDGICIECGEEAQAVPDVYLVTACEACGCMGVIGAETLLAIGQQLKESEDDAG